MQWLIRKKQPHVRSSPMLDFYSLLLKAKKIGLTCDLPENKLDAKIKFSGCAHAQEMKLTFEFVCFLISYQPDVTHLQN